MNHQQPFSGNTTLSPREHQHLPETFAIQTRGLGKTYQGITALKSLDLQVPKHSICGFLGPNGAGKSTAMKLLLGLARPTSGSGTLLGYDIVRESIAIRQRVGYLAQDPHFYEQMTARETLRFAARFFYAGPTAAIEDRVVESLDLVGLTGKADRPIKGFSGGERQRLGIAQAQINHPDLLILDEPAASLDPLGRRDVLEIMQRLRQSTTIFYSTHLLDDVQRVSDRVAILKQGELIAQAPIDALLSGSDKVTYELTMQGETQAAYTRLTQQPWVSTIKVEALPDRTIWQVAVNDERTAQAQLVALVTADGLMSVIGFGRKQYQLEDIFVSMIEEKKHAS
jgi:ABC-2 type transport system ATP-binding protein